LKNRQIFEILEKNFKENPTKVAVVDKDKSISYKRLYEMAATFCEEYKKSDEIILLPLDRNCENVARMWGAVLAGVPFAHIDYEMPKDYIEKKVASIKNSKLPKGACYVTFSSGSLGNPKGIVIGYEGLWDFINAFVKELELGEDCVFGGIAPFDFDISIKDIFGSAMCRGTLVLIEKGLIRTPEIFVKFLADNKVNTLVWPASALEICQKFDVFSNVKLKLHNIIFGGEVLSKDAFLYLKNNFDARLINVYGPSEITCNCLYYVANEKSVAPLPLGDAFASHKVRVVDGEIVVGGTPILMGYVTAKGFEEYKDEYFYTGDLVDFVDDQMYFGGRRDRQIKRNGYRISLDELENFYKKFDGISNCCIVAKDQLKLVYSGEMSKEKIVEISKLHLPKYSIPNKYIKVDLMQLNSHGKVDRGYYEENY